jgi:hypothetical protein
MNAAYYNAEPGSRMIDEMFYECADARNDDLGDFLRNYPELTDDTDGELEDPTHGDIRAETSDDIDDAYDREKEQEYEEDFD